MNSPKNRPDRVCDVLIAGAGLAGFAAAIAFARAGFDVVCCGAAERTGGGRTVALLARSVAYLESLGVWTPIEAFAAPMRGLRVIDDTGALFPPRPVEFVSSEIGLEAFGWNVENDRMAGALAAEAVRAPRLERIAQPVATYEFAPGKALARLDDGRRIAARLVIGADGRDSPSRRMARLEARTWSARQRALTALVAHRLPHGGFSTEFHTCEGPFTLVPLRASAAAPDRSSLVWVMSEEQGRRRGALDEETLAGEVERQAHSILGAMRVEGERGVFPIVRLAATRITALRLALVGDAAHALPPIGAQGLNLGLRDVEAIVEIAVSARGESRDIGGAEALERYERSRRRDIALRTGLVNGLNQALLTRLPPLDFARGAALAAVGAIGPLRRFVMREGVAPGLARRTT